VRPPQTLELNEQQRAELEDLRDHSPLPYLRERAAALLKIAAGMAPLEVAQYGLLRPRDSDTIYRWLGRYRTQGLQGLRIRKGRGRKPAFSPSAR
jgi:transposase